MGKLQFLDEYLQYVVILNLKNKFLISDTSNIIVFVFSRNTILKLDEDLGFIFTLLI